MIVLIFYDFAYSLPTPPPPPPPQHPHRASQRLLQMSSPCCNSGGCCGGQLGNFNPNFGGSAFFISPNALGTTATDGSNANTIQLGSNPNTIQLSSLRSSNPFETGKVYMKILLRGKKTFNSMTITDHLKQFNNSTNLSKNINFTKYYYF